MSYPMYSQSDDLTLVDLAVDGRPPSLPQLLNALHHILAGRAYQRHQGQELADRCFRHWSCLTDVGHLVFPFAGFQA